MISDLAALLNQKAEFVHERIRDAGCDPMFEEADGELEELGYFSPASLGIDVTIGGDGLVDTMHIFSDSQQDRKGYEGPLPCGLSFGMNRKAVRDLLGVALVLDSTKVYWDRWLREDYELHCEYPEDESRIRMVTITRTRNAELGASPNGGPALRFRNSGAGGGPPSVS